MGYFNMTPEQLAQIQAMYGGGYVSTGEPPPPPAQPKCLGCGKFMSKGDDGEMYVTLSNSKTHLECVDRAVDKIRETNPKWEW